jgi:hypothetical protein
MQLFIHKSEEKLRKKIHNKANGWGWKSWKAIKTTCFMHKGEMRMNGMLKIIIDMHVVKKKI